MSKKTRIVITGITGFVGQHLLEDIDVSVYDITVITRNVSKKMRIEPKGVTILEANLLDVDSLEKAFEGNDVLINLAAEVRNISQLEETNVQGTKNIIEAVRRTGIQHVIHLSSVGVVGKGYNDTTTIVGEEHLQDPKNEYERTKLISEKIFLEAAKEHNLGLTVLRPTNVIGEFHPFDALLNLMVRIQSKKVLLYRDNAVVNYVYVKDLTYLIIDILKTGKDVGIMNVGNHLQLKQFYTILGKYLDVKLTIAKIPSFLIKLAILLKINQFKGFSNKVIYSDDKMRKNFGYHFGIEKGLERVIEYYRKNNKLK